VVRRRNRPRLGQPGRQHRSLIAGRQQPARRRFSGGDLRQLGGSTVGGQHHGMLTASPYCSGTPARYRCWRAPSAWHNGLVWGPWASRRMSGSRSCALDRCAQSVRSDKATLVGNGHALNRRRGAGMIPGRVLMTVVGVVADRSRSMGTIHVKIRRCRRPCRSWPFACGLAPIVSTSCRRRDQSHPVLAPFYEGSCHP
jgi:hypothetical protein